MTETGPYIPVSLGFSCSDTVNEGWEEVLDEMGIPTGVERRSFRFRGIYYDKCAAKRRGIILEYS